MAGVTAVDITDAMELLTVVAVRVATAVLLVVLDAGQWSDQRASQALVNERLAVEEGKVLFCSDPVEVTFAYGARHPGWLEVGSIALAVVDVDTIVLFRIAD